jgi:hypothetical protein
MSKKSNQTQQGDQLGLSNMIVPPFLMSGYGQGHSAPFNSQCGETVSEVETETDVETETGGGGTASDAVQDWYEGWTSASAGSSSTTTTRQSPNQITSTVDVEPVYNGPCMEIKLSVGSNSIDYESDPQNPIMQRMVLMGGRGWSIFELSDNPDDLLKLVYDSGDHIEQDGCDAFPWARKYTHTHTHTFLRLKLFDFVICMLHDYRRRCRRRCRRPWEDR